MCFFIKICSVWYKVWSTEWHLCYSILHKGQNCLIYLVLNYCRFYCEIIHYQFITFLNSMHYTLSGPWEAEVQQHPRKKNQGVLCTPGKFVWTSQKGSNYVEKAVISMWAPMLFTTKCRSCRLTVALPHNLNVPLIFWCPEKMCQSLSVWGMVQFNVNEVRLNIKC